MESPFPNQPMSYKMDDGVPKNIVAFAETIDTLQRAAGRCVGDAAYAIQQARHVPAEVRPGLHRLSSLLVKVAQVEAESAELLREFIADVQIHDLLTPPADEETSDEVAESDENPHPYDPNT